MRIKPVDHLLQQIASNLGDARRGIEIGEMSLGEAQITVETVEQNLERVLQRLEMMLFCRILFGSHFRLRFEPKRAHISQQMAENLQLIGRRETLELQHHRRIKRSDVAMPDVARHAGEEDVGVAAFERARHRQLGNGMALPEIFAQKKRVDARGVAAHDHVLVIVWKNLRLDEVARAEQVR